MKLHLAILALACILMHKVASQQLNDMGDCACVCGLQSNGGVIGANGVAPVSDNCYKKFRILFLV